MYEEMKSSGFSATETKFYMQELVNYYLHYRPNLLDIANETIEYFNKNYPTKSSLEQLSRTCLYYRKHIIEVNRGKKI